MKNVKHTDRGGNAMKKLALVVVLFASTAMVAGSRQTVKMPTNNDKPQCCALLGDGGPWVCGPCPASL
jgi:hypothetical protein